MTSNEPRFFLPVGTVTFMLTDVEGSVRLWEHDPEMAATAMLRLGGLVDAAVGHHGGVRPREQGEGDSAVAAFSRATDALAASLELQRAIRAETWDSLPLRIRVGLHTGEAQLRDEGDYFGVAINRCARLRSLAHGGQTLLSRSTYELVVDRLPEGVSLRDLGAHRLRDLSRAEHVYELRHPDLPEEFPALHSLDSLPNNLPVQLTSFVGRARETAEIKRILEDARLVTLTGAGGCGKTRLALQVAADLLDDYSDGVWFVDLAPVIDAVLVANAVASVLSLPDEPFRSVADVIAAHLRAKKSLLVLDNCEQVVNACAELVVTLLRLCPSVTVLSTSREPLGVSGETSIRVPSLSAPDPHEHASIDSVGQYEAVQLFIERATKTRPNFAVTNENAAAVAQICARLDGIPLAIELAAARTRMLAPQQVLDGLTDRFRLLTGGARTAVPRQQTLRASVDWSHQLLSEAERIVLRRLSVFTTFTLDAAEVVCADHVINRLEILDVLSGLVDKSLLMPSERETAARYRLLETVRQYAFERLVEAAEEVAVRQRHLAYCVDLAERAAPHLNTASHDEWVERLDAEVSNLRSALRWAESQQDGASLLTLCASLTSFWIARDQAEGRRWFEIARPYATQASAPLRQRYLGALAWLAMFSQDIFTAKKEALDAIEIAREIGDEHAIASNLVVIGFSTMHTEGAGAALPFLEEAASLARASGDDRLLAGALNCLAECHVTAGDLDGARRLAQEAHEVGLRTANRLSIRIANWVTGWAADWQGDLEEARRRYENGITEAREAGDRWTLTFELGFLGDVLRRLGAYEESRGHLTETLELARETQNPLFVAGAQYYLAALSTAEGDLSSVVQERLAEALVLTEALPMPAFRSGALLAAGYAEIARADLPRATAYLEEALRISRHANFKYMQGGCLLLLGRAARLAGDSEVAENLCHEAVQLQHEVGDRVGIAESLETLAGIAAEQESYREAARLLGAAETIRAATHAVAGEPDRAVLERDRAVVIKHLDDDFDDALTEGKALSIDEAVAYADRGRGERKRPSSGWASLTPTELDVVRLVSQGLSNPAIAKRMFIASGTVKIHMSHIFSKLGISSRSELAAAATRRGL